MSLRFVDFLSQILIFPLVMDLEWFRRWVFSRFVKFWASVGMSIDFINLPNITKYPLSMLNNLSMCGKNPNVGISRQGRFHVL